MIVSLNESSLRVAITLYTILFSGSYPMIKEMIMYSKNSLSLMLVKVLFVLTLVPLPFTVNAAILVYSIH